ncbi:hypothetical protein GmHk_16G046097 [Glycine max]|nr:hypothetical protein GmHk_16G046097 [Glycine max]
MLFFNKHMTTPPSSPPPPELATWLRSLATRLVRMERPMVHVDPTTGKADGPHRKKLRMYLGIVARDKVDKEVFAAQKDMIWEGIKAEFDILEASDQRTKKKILKMLKSDLTSKWDLAQGKEEGEGNVCKKYNISKEKWQQFCRSCRDPSWEDVRKKAQAIQKLNTTLHVLSHRGYDLLKERLMEEKQKKRLEQAAQSGSTKTIVDPPSPIRRQVK